MKRAVLAGIVAAAAIACSARLEAYHTGQDANLVVGQPDFSQIQANQAGAAGARTLNTPSSLYQSSQNLFAVDINNNRVLIFALPLSSVNAQAVAVIGQNDFLSVQPNQGGTAGPTTLNFTSGCTDGALAGNGTDLFIADSCNHRVLIYLDIATKIAAWPGTPITADRVIGQPNFITTTANNGGLSIKSLSLPIGLSAAGAKLLIVDNANRRVLVFNTMPAASFAPADLVIGKSTFNTVGSPPSDMSRSTITAAIDVWTDGTKVAVAEEGPSHRVLLWDTFPVANGAPADHVVGQASFVNNTANAFGSDDPRSLSNPRSVSFDGTRLFIFDKTNKRALVYNGWPTALNSIAADMAIGKKGFVGGLQAKERITLGQAKDLFAVPGLLYVSDTERHRILGFPDLFGVYAISPSTVTFGNVSTDILGDDFTAGIQAKLTRTGQSDIIGTNLTLASQTLAGLYQKIRVNFNTAGVQSGKWNVVLTSGARTYTFEDSLFITPYTVSEVLPNFGYNKTATAIFVKGANFPATASLTLIKAGQNDIVATDVVVISSGILRGTVDLKKVPTGLWGVLVSSGVNVVSFDNSFVVGAFPFGEIEIEATKKMSSSIVDDVLAVGASNNGLTDTRLLVPGSAISANIVVDVGIGAVKNPPPAPDGYVYVKNPIDLSPSGMEFNQDVTLEIPYDASDVQTAGGQSTSGWRGMVYDPESNQWSNVTTSIDTANQRVQLTTRHFSIYALMGQAVQDLASVKIYPNPFIPSLGHSAIHFTSLPPDAKVRVFSATGEEIWSGENAGAGALDWDALNLGQKPVASGVYIALIESSRGKTKRKLAIER